MINSFIPTQHINDHDQIHRTKDTHEQTLHDSYVQAKLLKSSQVKSSQVKSTS